LRPEKGLAIQRFLCEMNVSALPIAEGEATAAATEPGPDDAALLVSGLTRRFGTREVLRGVDLAIAPGESVLVSGHNGAGKTTLLRLITGVIAPDAGSITMFGLDAQEQRRECQRRIGLLPAGDRAIYARLTVRKNLDFWARISFVPRKRRPAAIDAALAAFDIEELHDRRCDRLSMGQRQRVRLAMAFLHSPDLLLLDEPDTSLDENGLETLSGAVDDALARGAACLWCGPTGGRKAIASSRSYVITDGLLEPA
jgi:heme ABC exporter ATP-binding subunit CcmA